MIMTFINTTIERWSVVVLAQGLRSELRSQPNSSSVSDVHVSIIYYIGGTQHYSGESCWAPCQWVVHILEGPSNRDEALGVCIVDSVTGRTESLVRT